jgi:shikimate kinase
LSNRALAVAHGAVTIVNAIALGRGAAFGVDLWTKAEVKLTSEAGIVEVEILSDVEECPQLVKKTALGVMKRFGLEKSFGAQIRTQSNIPIARGLKSSSTAANATALATVAALGKHLDDLEVIKIGVQAAFDAQVTLTGAFDDACASYFGGVVITDNLNQKILKQMTLPQELAVLFYVPSQKAYTINADTTRLKTVKPLVEIAFEKAMQGEIWDALTLNGLAYSAASNQDMTIAIDALAAGATAAGLCGKGPAIAAITSSDAIDKVRVSLQKYEGEIILAYPNSKKATVI